MEADSFHQVTIEFDADDDLWLEGQRALQDTVAEAQRDDPTLTTAQITLPGTRGIGDLLLNIAGNTLGALLAQLATYLATAPRRPRTIRLETAPAVPVVSPAPIAPPHSSSAPSQIPTLEIDCAELIKELNNQSNGEAINEDIQRWVAIAVSDAERLIIRIRLR